MVRRKSFNNNIFQLPDDVQDEDLVYDYEQNLPHEDFNSDFFLNSAEMNMLRAEDLDEVGESSSSAVSLIKRMKSIVFILKISFIFNNILAKEKQKGGEKRK